MWAGLLAWLKALPVIDSIIARLVLIWDEFRRDQFEEEQRDQLKRRDERHEEIRANPGAHAHDRKWLRNPAPVEPADVGRREDGAPKDYDVSGKGGALDRE